MAIYHFSGQAFNRGDGRSSVAAACYRAAERILDFRTGEIHDYTRKSEVEETAIFIPGGATMTRSVLWNAVEAKHKRSDAVVARELEISLPIELSKAERKKLAFAYAQELAEKYRIAVDVCIHEKKGNPHMHLMLSACHVEADGTFGKKCVELDPIHCQRAKIENLMDTQRPRWQDLCNAALERSGSAERIDHRSFVERGITDKLAGWHRGPVVSGITSRGEVSEIAEREAKKLAEFIAKAQADAAIELARQSAHAEVARLEQELAQAQAQAAAKENVTATRSVLPPLTVDALETRRKKQVEEDRRLHDRIRILNDERIKAKDDHEIEAAKITLTDLSKRLSSLEVRALENELATDRLNFKFGGLYEMLPDWLAPERVRLKAQLEKDRAAVKTIQARLQKAKAIADAKDVALVDLELANAKKRKAQVLAEVQDIDADLVKARQREQFITKPVPVKHSRLVQSHDQEHDLSL